MPLVSDDGRWRLSIDRFSWTTAKLGVRRSGRSRLCYQAQNATVCPHPIISIHGAKQQTPVATNITSRNKTRRAPGKCSCRPTKLQTVKGLYGAYEPGFVSLDAHNCVQTNGREVETEDGTNRINPSPEYGWRISLTAYAERRLRLSSGS